MEGRTEVKQYTPLPLQGAGGIKIKRETLSVVLFFVPVQVPKKYEK
jgi:hypothetical protein